MKLKSMTLYPTLRCNLTCEHCWIQAGTEFSQELSLEEMVSAIDSAQNLGLDSVRITGGEPFLREEVLGELLKYLDEVGMNTSIETNGTLLTAQSKKIITETCSGVMISMDGVTSRGFASLRGNPHLFDTVVETIKSLRDSGVPVIRSMAIHKGNIDELDTFVHLPQDFGSARILLYIEMGRAKNLKTKFTAQESIDVIKRMNSFMKENPKISSNIPLALLDSDVPYYECLAGRDSLALLPDGSVSFCAYCMSEDSMIAGNIRESCLEDIWEKGLIFEQCQKIESSLEGVCSLCIFKKYCQGSCRAWAYDRYGSLYAPYPLCQELYEKGFFPEQYLLEGEIHEK
jgi:radical SAM protein with 4Fe4S-binding SPASM domain